MSFYGQPGWNYGQQGATQNALFYGVHGSSTFQPTPVPYGGSMRRNSGSMRLGSGSMRMGSGSMRMSSASIRMNSGSMLATGGSFYDSMQRADSFYANPTANTAENEFVQGGISPLPPSSAAAGMSTAADRPGTSGNAYYTGDAFTTASNHGGDALATGAADQQPAADDANSQDTPPPLQRKNSSGRLLRRKVSFSGVPQTLPPEVEPRSETTTPKRLGTRRLSGASTNAEDERADSDGDVQQQQQQQQQLYYQQQFPSSLPYAFPSPAEVPSQPLPRSYSYQQEPRWPQQADAVTPPQQHTLHSGGYGWQQQQRQPPPQYQQETPPSQNYYPEQPPQYVSDPQQIQFAAQAQAALQQELPSQNYEPGQQQQEDDLQHCNVRQLQPTLATSGAARRGSLGSLSRRNSQMRPFPMGHPMNPPAPGMQNFPVMPFPRPVYRPTFNVYRNVPYGVYNANMAMYQRQPMPNYY